MLERVVYVSRVAPGVGRAEVEAMVRRARARNGAEGVSGALLYLDNFFAQVLEGAPDQVQASYARIAQDPRHHGIDRRIRQRVLCPAFRGMAMALRTEADIAPDLHDDFGYRPGFPVEVFPVDVLVEFALQACRPERLHRVAG